jgi:hypothetical protein
LFLQTCSGFFGLFFWRRARLYIVIFSELKIFTTFCHFRRSCLQKITTFFPLGFLALYVVFYKIKHPIYGALSQEGSQVFLCF